MPEVVSSSKRPEKVRAGQLGARARWGEQRVARLDSLAPSIRAAVLALLRADEAARKAADDAA